jgi:hypothetical protein
VAAADTSDFFVQALMRDCGELKSAVQVTTPNITTQNLFHPAAR